MMQRPVRASHNEVHLRSDRGAAFLEFGVALPVLLMLLLGIVSSGSVINTNNKMNSAAREASRFAATLPADNPVLWLNQVAEMAIGAASGEIDDGTPGRYVCVAYVYPEGPLPADSSVGNDHTVRLVVNESGTKKITAGAECYSDGLPESERRVQVMIERVADLEFGLFDREVTLDGESTTRFDMT
jgi:hypothetical protein